MKKNISKILIGAFILGLIGSSSYATPVSAKTSNSDVKQVSTVTQKTQLKQSEKDQLVNWFNSYNVSNKIQTKLIAKLEGGQDWDSFNPKNHCITTKGTLPTGEKYIKKVFDDGSISVQTIDLSEAEVTQVNLANSEITPTAIDPGQITHGTGYTLYTNAKVYASNGSVTASFRTSFYLTQGGSDGITMTDIQKSTYLITVLGGTYSGASLNVIPNESYDPASAILTFDWTIYGGAASHRANLALYVGNDTYWTSDNIS